MHIVLIILFLLLLVYGPQWWARYTFRRYADVLPRIPGTGGELARTLLDHFGMPEVPVEKTEQGGDHYDPERRAVRLSPDNYDHKALPILRAGHYIRPEDEVAVQRVLRR